MYRSQKHWTTNQLRWGGWTVAMIERFLGDPDRRRKTSRNRNGAWYDQSRVALVEQTEEFAAARAAAVRRRQRAAQRGPRAATRIGKVMQIISRKRRHVLVRRVPVAYFCADHTGLESEMQDWCQAALSPGSYLVRVCNQRYCRLEFHAATTQDLTAFLLRWR